MKENCIKFRDPLFTARCIISNSIGFFLLLIRNTLFDCHYLERYPLCHTWEPRKLCQNIALKHARVCNAKDMSGRYFLTNLWTKICWRVFVFSRDEIQVNDTSGKISCHCLAMFNLNFASILHCQGVSTSQRGGLKKRLLLIANNAVLHLADICVLMRFDLTAITRYGPTNARNTKP